MSAVVVKPLDWVYEPGDHWLRWQAVHQRAVVHTISRQVVNGSGPYLLAQRSANAAPYPTLEAAQAAAQEEWSAFVLAAITTP